MKTSPITRIDDDTADEDDELILIDCDGEVLVHQALLGLIEQLDNQPISVGSLCLRLDCLLPSSAEARPDQILETGFQCLIQTGAVEVMAKE